MRKSSVFCNYFHFFKIFKRTSDTDFNLLRDWVGNPNLFKNNRKRIP